MASGGCERAGADACPQTSRQQSTKRSKAGPVGGSPVVNTFERWAAGPFERNKARLVEEAFPRPVLLPLATAVSSACAKPGLVVKDVSGTKVRAAKSAENEGGQHAAQLQESSGEVARLKQTGRSEQRGSEPNQPAARRPGPQPSAAGGVTAPGTEAGPEQCRVPLPRNAASREAQKLTGARRCDMRLCGDLTLVFLKSVQNPKAKLFKR